jgi:hypothetical protein
MGAMQAQDHQIRVEFTLPAPRFAELEALSSESGVRKADIVRYALYRLMQDPRGFVGPPAAALDVLERNERAANGGG